jgi:uncharacterized protein involved in exopolysaccharide biosynthesis
MASPAPPLPPSTPGPGLADAEGAGGIDYARAAAIARFVLRAPRRRPLLAILVLALSLLATVAVAVCSPRVYVASTRILVQRNVVIPLLGNPRRPLPADWDVPTRGTSETILRRDNLVAMIRETNLEERWNVGRSPLSRLLDAVTRVVFGPMSEEDRMSALIGALEKRITVQADDTTISIAVAWYDPVVAHQLVTCAERNFFKERGDTETSAITETIAILEEEAARQREAIDAGLAAAQKMQPPPPLAAPAAQAAPTPARPFGAPRRPGADRGWSAGAPAEGGGTIAVDLAQKRSAIQAIEDPWQRRVVDLKGQLATLRLTYASAHPSVITLEEKIRQASVEPPELTVLKREEGSLLAQIRQFSPGDGKLGEAQSPALGPVVAAREPVAEAAAPRDDSPELVAVRARLLAAVQKYEDLRDRIDSARLEINTARAAFKYRYAIVSPAEVPKRPVKPSVLLIVLVGLGLGILLSFAAAAGKDLRSDRFIEVWQIERLPIPMLAEVKTP